MSTTCKECNGTDVHEPHCREVPLIPYVKGSTIGLHMMTTLRHMAENHWDVRIQEGPHAFAVETPNAHKLHMILEIAGTPHNVTAYTTGICAATWRKEQPEEGFVSQEYIDAMTTLDGLTDDATNLMVGVNDIWHRMRTIEGVPAGLVSEIAKAAARINESRRLLSRVAMTLPSPGDIETEAQLVERMR